MRLDTTFTIIAILYIQILTGCYPNSLIQKPVHPTETLPIASTQTDLELTIPAPSPIMTLTQAQVLVTMVPDNIKFEISSPAFTSSNPIPVEYTCDGNNMSPPLAWRGTPEEIKTFALIVDDPDSPGGTWVHWVLYNIPANRTDLPEGISVGETIEGVGVQGKSSFKEIKYGGPCPPLGSGIHHYHFKLYALDTRLFLPPAASKSDVQKAMQNHILNQAEIIGTYQREIKNKGS
jgi:Raf kinase inhibitor-like YbhB/YbcL family protein